jgi:hypothetical protein
MLELHLSILLLVLSEVLAFLSPAYYLHGNSSNVSRKAGARNTVGDLPRHSRPAASSDDRFSDGTPDFLRLDTPSDQVTFRRRAAPIAEFQELRPATSTSISAGPAASRKRLPTIWIWLET